MNVAFFAHLSLVVFLSFTRFFCFTWLESSRAISFVCDRFARSCFLSITLQLAVTQSLLCFAVLARENFAHSHLTRIVQALDEKGDRRLNITRTAQET